MRGFLLRFARPIYRLWLGIVLFVASIVGWPLSLVSWASAEPPFVLSLSWLALTLTAIDIIFTAAVALEEEKRGE